MLVSIIIPIYNGAKYINKLYKSLSNQTFQNFELLYINDGSSDNSLDILMEISKKDKRVSIYNQKNKGICASRNLGIFHSHGKYIIFLDQDDGIEHNLVENYVMTIEREKVDMVAFGKIHYFIDNGIVKSKKYQKFKNEQVFNKTKIYEYLFNIDNSKRLMTIWNCIYRKDIIQKFSINFDEHFKHGDEDGMFNIEYVLKCNSIYFSNQCYYHYYIRNGLSTITKYNSELLNNYIYFINKLCYLTSEIQDEYINELIKLYILRFFSNLYIRFCKYNYGINNKIYLLEKINNIENFKHALSFSNKKYYKKFSVKYFYWDIFNFFLKRKKYIVSIWLLDFLRILKRI